MSEVLNGQTGTGGQFYAATNDYNKPAGPINNGIDGFLGNAESLTPEALFIYCATQLKSLDADIKAFMNKQKTMNYKKKVLQELKTKLEGNSTLDKSATVTDARAANINKAYKEAYADLMAAGHVDEADLLAKDFQSWYPNDDIAAKTTNLKDYKCPTETQSSFDEKVNQIENMIDELTKNSELNMIQLQSIMSQRQTAVQLTTNMLDKFHKGLDQIAANFK
jgi:hypothetical protein